MGRLLHLGTRPRKRPHLLQMPSQTGTTVQGRIVSWQPFDVLLCRQVTRQILFFLFSSTRDGRV